MKAYQGGLVLVLGICLWGQQVNAVMSITRSLYVITIGIDAYESNPLQYAVADARAMAMTLKRGAEIPYVSGPLTENTRIGLVELVDQQAGKTAILRALQAVEQAAGAGDVFVFYFSGHVMSHEGQTYLVPHDAALSDPGAPDTAGLIRADELQAALDKVPATHRLWLFDGGNYLDIDTSIQGTHVLQATGPGGMAAESRGHGHYTAVLLQALQGWGDADQDGRVSVMELMGFVGHHLPAISSHRQFPTIRLYGEDFPLVVTLGGENLSASEGNDFPMDARLETVGLEDKLDVSLVDLIRVYEADSQVEVTINAISPGAIRFLEQQVVRMGGSVETDFENLLYATLPVEALRRFAMQPFVWRMDRSRQVAAPPGSTDTGVSIPGSDK